MRGFVQPVALWLVRHADGAEQRKLGWNPCGSSWLSPPLAALEARINLGLDNLLTVLYATFFVRWPACGLLDWLIAQDCAHSLLAERTTRAHHPSHKKHQGERRCPQGR